MLKIAKIEILNIVLTDWSWQEIYDPINQELLSWFLQFLIRQFRNMEFKKNIFYTYTLCVNFKRIEPGCWITALDVGYRNKKVHTHYLSAKQICKSKYIFLFSQFMSTCWNLKNDDMKTQWHNLTRWHHDTMKQWQ